MDLVAILVQDERCTAQHTRSLTGKAAEALALECDIFPPYVLHDDLVGELPRFRRQLFGANDLGDDEVGVEGNEQIGTIVIEKTIGTAARCTDRVNVMVNGQCQGD